MKAVLTNYRQSPRKVRLIADLIRGKKIDVADTQLAYLTKRGALPFRKLLASAVANAKSQGLEIEELIVKYVAVDQGVTLKRSRPRARGSASKINKRQSHVVLMLGTKDVKKKSNSHLTRNMATTAPKKEKKVVKKAVKKEVKEVNVDKE